MAEMTPTFADYRSRLDAAVTAFSLFLRDLCPEAQLEISFIRYSERAAPCLFLSCICEISLFNSYFSER